MFVPEYLSNIPFMQLRARICVAMLGVFRTWSSHMAERRAGIGTRRKTEGERVAWAEFARTRLLRRTIASVCARSRVNARLLSNRRHIAENRRLLLPVMISLRSWFVRRFRAITGEIFFARNVSPRAGNAVSPGRALQHHARDIPSRLHRPLKSEARSGRFAGPNAGESAGRESPVPPDQAIDSARDFGAKIFSHKKTPEGVPGDIPRWWN